MNRLALITGATSGIGKATAELFAQHHIDLILCGRRSSRLENLKRELERLVKVKTLCFDIGIVSEVENNLNSLSGRWKNIDILINNAGGAHGLEPMVDGDICDWDKMIDYNVKGLLYVSKNIASWMMKKRKGHIVNISSIAGKQTYKNGMVYCASKSSVESISKGMRLELVPHGIKVTNIAPGAVDTEFSNVRFKGDQARAQSIYSGYDDSRAKNFIKSCLLSVNTCCSRSRGFRKYGNEHSS
jgi:NADP-dependent 3-hydroxy acid dehydrogenase YdfG